MPEDWTDRHVARWRDHWLDIAFDDQVEAAFVRVGRIDRYLRQAKQRAVAEVGLTDFEYDTLHVLMIRDTPGSASPTELAGELDVSGAGMTGRLDGLEKAGWIRRIPSVDDRRRVIVEVTKAGIEVWRRAMDIRGEAENDLADALTERELATLNRLLKKVTVRSEERTHG
ncbi:MULTISPECIES: MarR family winged helix-turn-helix transcriptional regulator [unclassified Nocardioides]|jgi:DNA-binding MarR family transcriptional regulator|uniref:MarR family winged helix-turn-helix transcriptional regulator n=1 Tax=unclassified Nocardioides TaxID=2615069 RepID=UPI0007030020|nr:MULTISPECIES: MarR family transcriptional regulator [unclassified Nocardioides]KRC53218.1 MarR family transcriptional regulator [Nocardioides sp. Root79]KRC70555.1 MarR family transcriptional regulator [Nocardioides sp. Root240]